MAPTPPIHHDRREHALLEQRHTQDLPQIVDIEVAPAVTTGRVIGVRVRDRRKSLDQRLRESQRGVIFLVFVDE
jgi:hypothetical protein